MLEEKRIVVTGLGAFTPIGKTIKDFWDNLVKGKSNVKECLHKYNPNNINFFKTKFASILDYNPEEYFDKKDIRRLDIFTQYAILSSNEAIDDSGLDLHNIDTSRAGVVWASGIGGISSIESEFKNYFVEGNSVSPFLITRMIPDTAPGIISIKYGFMGPNYSTVSACSSSSNSIIDAYNLIKLGHGEIFITGGSENISEMSFLGFSVLKALSRRNDDPNKASRPFDKNRDGFVLGEGSGTIILEELEHAKKRKANIYAELIGVGMSADAYHITSPHPQGDGLKLVMNNALKNANLKTSDIDYINAHGTSTTLGDIAEAKAIEGIFENNLDNLSISATKSITGHLLGASGAIESIASILSVKNNIIPPTINLDQRDPEISPKLDLVSKVAKSKIVNYAMSNNFGFGGHNCAIIFKKYNET